MVRDGCFVSNHHVCIQREERKGALGSGLPHPHPLPMPPLCHPPTSLAVGCAFLHVKGPVPNGRLAGRAGKAVHMPGHL